MLRTMLVFILMGISYASFTQAKNTKKPVVTSVKKPPPITPKKTTGKKVLVKHNPLVKDTIKSVKKIIAPPLKMAVREQNMINEINFVRTNPTAYRNFVVDYLKLKNVDPAARKAGDELLAILEKLKPMSPLTFSDKLYQQAKIHGHWMADADQLEHSAFGNGENLVAGVANIREAVIYLLVDAPDKNRGHRKNILNPNYKTVAVFEVPGTVMDMQYAFVQEFNFK